MRVGSSLVWIEDDGYGFVYNRDFGGWRVVGGRHILSFVSVSHRYDMITVDIGLVSYSFIGYAATV